MYKLDKPYTNEQREDFIVEYNHNKTLKIEETETALYALEPWEKLVNSEVIDNTEEYEQEQATARKKQFNQEFFPTSLGYIRRNVTMQNGLSKSFLTDLLPLMRAGVPILAYNKPNFNKKLTPEELLKLQKKVIVTEEFLSECQNQVIIDFYGFNPIKTAEEEL